MGKIALPRLETLPPCATNGQLRQPGLHSPAHRRSRSPWQTGSTPRLPDPLSPRVRRGPPQPVYHRPSSRRMSTLKLVVVHVLPACTPATAISRHERSGLELALAD